MLRPAHILDTEHDPRILRDLAKMLDGEVLRLHGVIRDIQSEQAKQAQLKIGIEESLRVLRKKYFGKKSEKLDDHGRERDRLNTDPELTLHSQSLLPPPNKKQVRDLETLEVIHALSERDLKSISEALELKNPEATQWEEIPGLFDQSVEITVIEREYKKVIHKRKKYRLKKEFEISEKQVLIAAPGAVKLIPGSSYSIDFTVASIVDKYVNHIPLERQSRAMSSLGLDKMHTQVLYNLARVAGEHLVFVVDKIKNEILSQELVHSDETRWPINNGKDSNGFMWIVSNQAGSYYRFEPSRSGKIVKETLEGFTGVVMSDAYSGYYQFKKSQTQELALCHAHARRNFWDIKEDNPETLEILNLWEELFKFEKLPKNFTELMEIRKARSRPVIDSMKKWLNENLIVSRPESLFRKAIQYCLNHWKELTKFLDNPVIPLTNNEAERTIRHAVMGRKNFYGSRSIDGADLCATMYTIIESCKKVELDPRKYFLFTLKKSAAGEPTETPLEMAKRLRQ